MCKSGRFGLMAVALGLALPTLPAAIPATQAAQHQETVPSFPSEAEAVTVDVVVLDSAGKPLRGLTKADFTLLEDGHPQTIVGFEAVDSSAPEPAAANPSGSAAAAGPARVAAPNRVIAFLVDDLGLNVIRNGADARKAIAGWIEAAADPRDAVVLVTTSGDVFWSGRIGPGRDELLAALAHVKGRKQTDGMSGPQPISDWEAYRIATEGQGEAASGPGEGVELQRVVDRWLALNICAGPPAPRAFCTGQVNARAKEVYQDALRRSRALFRETAQLAESLESLRGRKSIFVFSDGVLRDTSDDSLERAVSRAQRANAVVYFIDSRGLATPSMYSAQVTKAPEPGDVVATSFEETTLGVGGTEALAEETGGTSVRNTNDLLRGLARVANESSAYYMLGFQPERAPDGKWRKLTVKVNRSKVTVRARKGYMPAPRKPAPPDFEGPLVAALDGGAPPHDLDYRVGVLHFAPRGAEREALMLLEVPFSSVQGQADVGKGRLGILGVVRDDIGRTLARVSQDWTVVIPTSGPPAPEFAVFKGRLRLAPGRYTLETAVQDRGSQRIGTHTAPLEIPATTTGLALSSIALIGSGAPAPEAPGDVDPLHMSGLSITPNLGVPYPEGTRELPFLVHVYSTKGNRAALTVDLRRGETTLGTVSPEMPETDAEGHVVWAGSFPAGRLPSGHYTIRVAARRGALVAQEDAAFEIVPAPKAASTPAVAVAPAAPLDPRLAAILDRAGRYVVEYERTFRNLVAEEVSNQWAGESLETTDSLAPRRRTLRSDLVFTTLPGALPWGCFRDVFEVDGQKVHDREARLEKLFVHGSSASAVERANAILEESSRYNIGVAKRTANVPTYPLLFLHPSNQARFRFEIKGRRRFHDQEGIELHFTEIARPTLLNGGRSGDLPASGSFWVAEPTGTVLRSDVTFEFTPKRAVAWVGLDYRPEPGLHIWVPEEMKERYEDLPDAIYREFGESTEATSRYSNYRRFSVTTNEGVVSAVEP